MHTGKRAMHSRNREAGGWCLRDRYPEHPIARQQPPPKERREPKGLGPPPAWEPEQWIEEPDAEVRPLRKAASKAVARGGKPAQQHKGDGPASKLGQRRLGRREAVLLGEGHGDAEKRSPAVRSQKRPPARAATLTRPPAAALRAPSTKPARRPTRFMSSEAGIVLRAVPITDVVEGSVARALLLARA